MRLSVSGWSGWRYARTTWCRLSCRMYLHTRPSTVACVRHCSSTKRIDSQRCTSIEHITRTQTTSFHTSTSSLRQTYALWSTKRNAYTCFSAGFITSWHMLQIDILIDPFVMVPPRNKHEARSLAVSVFWSWFPHSKPSSGDKTHSINCPFNKPDCLVAEQDVSVWLVWWCRMHHVHVHRYDVYAWWAACMGHVRTHAINCRVMDE